MRPTITKNEWRWAALWASLIMLITSLPYLYGLALSTPEYQFSGFILGVEDTNSYLAKMRLGAEGGWLFHLLYTPEPHAGAYIYGFYLFLGKASRLLRLPPVLIYHLARLIFGLGLLATIYYFIAHFLTSIAKRRFAFLLAAVGSGLGWLLIVLGLTPALGLPLDLYVPEGFIFLVLLHLPHLALAESLLFLSILGLLYAWQTDIWLPALGAGLALFVMSLIAAFYLAVFTAVMGVFWVSLFLGKQTSFLQPAAAGEAVFNDHANFGAFRRFGVGLAKMALAVAIASPVLLYDAYVFLNNPIFNIWGRQNLILSPPVWHYLLAYGLLIVPAFYGGKMMLASSGQTGQAYKPLLLIVWCLIFPVLVYLPFNLQRRLVVGVQAPLTILAAYGFFAFCEKQIGPSRRNLVQIGIVIIFSLTNLFILAGGFAVLLGRRPPVFQPTAMIEATQWLAGKTNGEVVLATYETGNVLPIHANVRTFVGHASETVNSLEKQTQANRFFGNGVDDAWRLDLLREFNIAFVYYGPNEQARGGTGGFAPDEASYLEKIYDAQGVRIYRVVRNKN